VIRKVIPGRQQCELPSLLSFFSDMVRILGLKADQSDKPETLERRYARTTK